MAELTSFGLTLLFDRSVDRCSGPSRRCLSVFARDAHEAKVLDGRDIQSRAEPEATAGRADRDLPMMVGLSQSSDYRSASGRVTCSGTHDAPEREVVPL